MSFMYAATSQPPTAVNFSVTCNFTSRTDQNLVVVRSNRLEVFTFLDGINNPDGVVGLHPVLNVPLFGRVKGIEVISQANGLPDHLFILIDRKKFSIISYDQISKKVVTRVLCNVKERVGSDSEMGQRSFADPSMRIIGMQLYHGVIKMLPLTGLDVKDTFDVSLEEKVIDIKFLHGTAQPMMCVLYEAADRTRHVQTYVVNVQNSTISKGPWHQNNVEFGASLLIPVPMGGVLVVGLCTIAYISGTGAVNSVELSPCQITAHSRLDATGTRYLLGDNTGKLLVLTLIPASGSSLGALDYTMTTDLAGVTTIAETINVLEHGLVFVGSALGDSQLIKLHANRDAVEVIDVYPNIGPVLDMALVENSLVSGGQKQLVTCSGAYKDGSLRIIRNGIGIQEQASLGIEGIKGLWSMKTSGASDSLLSFDKYLVQSFLTETRVFAMEGEEMSEASLPGMDAMQPSLYCGNMNNNLFVQVTPLSIRLIDATTLQLVQVLPVEAASKITTASGNPTQVLISLSGGRVQYFELHTRSLELVSQIDMDQDVACQSMQPLSVIADASMKMEDDAEVGHPTSQLVSVGMWTDNSVRLLVLPTLQEVARVKLGTETQARDVLIVSFDSKNALTRPKVSEKACSVYLLVGMGDGALLTYTVDFSTGLPVLDNRKRGVLGTHPVTFRPFVNNEEQCVFACGDRPSIIYFRNNKLLFSNVDLQCGAITEMTPFHAELFPDCIAFATETTLFIGTIEVIQKLHIQTIPLGESPRRITHCPEWHCYAVCSEKITICDRGEQSTCRLLIFDDETFVQVAEFEFDPYEQALSVSMVRFAGEFSSPFLVVGTAQLVNEELEPSRGRLLVFQINEASMDTDSAAAERKMVLITEKELRSGAYAIAEVEGKLAVGIGSKVQIYRLVVRDSNNLSDIQHHELQAECSFSGHVMVCQLKSLGSYVLVGDIVRSFALLQYRSAESRLEEVARDFNCSYLRAVEFADGVQDHVLGADASGNIFSGRRQTETTKEEDRMRLDIRAEYHLGDFVNVMRRGALQQANIESDSDAINNAVNESQSSTSILEPEYKSVTGYPGDHNAVMYGTISGAIGTLLMLSESSYQFFAAVERATKELINSIGNFPHNEWRNFQTDMRLGSQKNVIDGDLVEMLLDLEVADIDIVVRKVNDDLTSYLQNLSATGNEKNGTGISSESASALIANLTNNRVNLSREDVIRRVEDIARLH